MPGVKQDEGYYPCRSPYPDQVNLYLQPSFQAHGIIQQLQLGDRASTDHISSGRASNERRTNAKICNNTVEVQWKAVVRAFLPGVPIMHGHT